MVDLLDDLDDMIESCGEVVWPSNGVKVNNILHYSLIRLFYQMDQVVDPVYQNHPHRRHCRSIDCAYM